MLCVPSARHLFGTASLASSALSASAELLVLVPVIIVALSSLSLHMVATLIEPVPAMPHSLRHISILMQQTTILLISYFPITLCIFSHYLPIQMTYGMPLFHHLIALLANLHQLSHSVKVNAMPNVQSIRAISDVQKTKKNSRCGGNIVGLRQSIVKSLTTDKRRCVENCSMIMKNHKSWLLSKDIILEVFIVV